MKQKITLFLLIFIGFGNLFSQSIGAIVADKDSRQPIADVFVFFDNSSTGDITDLQGKFTLNRSDYQNVTLVFSHLNYELLSVADKKNFPDTIFLTSRNVLLEEAVVVEKKVKKRIRSRWLKRFRTEFLGEDYDNDLVKLLNPEVLLFQSNKGVLTVKTHEPLLIENRFLGYMVSFYLEDYKSYQDGDLLYHGKVFFKELEGTKKERARYNRNRSKIYEKSSRKFFADLVQQKLDGQNYEIGFAVFNPKGEIVNYEQMPVDSISIKEIHKGAFEISINRILTVTNNQTKIQQAGRKQRGVLGNSIGNFKQTQNNIPRSYLWSKEGRIVVNKFGAILNSSEVEESGYWASLRVATLLPFDKLIKPKKERRL